MYRTLSLIVKNAKNKRALAQYTKGAFNMLYKETNRMGSFLTTSSRSFNTGEHRFEKLAERGSSQSMRQGKLNMKTTLNTENINTILTFIQDNVSSMNDGDYLDAMFLVSNKLENDALMRINLFNLEKTQGFQIIKKHIQTNFDRMSQDNYSNQILLILASQLVTRGRTRSIFDAAQLDKMVANATQNLELNHSKMTLQTIVNVISLIGMFKNINPNPYLKERNEDAASLGFPNTYRILRRIAHPRQQEIVRDSLSRFLVRDFMNVCATEKMLNKCRAFNVVAKLDWMSAFSSNHSKLVPLLKDIRAQAENHDQQSILQMIEGLTYFDDFTKTETLREFYDIVTMTIKHQPENVRLDFVLRFVELISQYKNDTALTQEHIKTIIDYATNSIVALSESNQRVPNTNSIVPIFLLMRKHKYYDNEVTVKLFNILEPNVHRFFINEYVKAFKFIVAKVLGDDYITRLENSVPETLMKELQALVDPPITRAMTHFQRAVFFGAKNPFTQQMFELLLQRLDSVFQVSDVNSLLNFVEDYVKGIQDVLPAQFRVPIIERIITKFDIKECGVIRNPARVLVALNELLIPREREDLRQKVNDHIKVISEDEKLRKTALGYFMRLSKESKSGISNATIYKFMGLIREYTKSEEYLKDNERIVSKLLEIAFNFLYNFDRDSSITTDSIMSISQFADFLHTKHPELPIDIRGFRATRIFKTFNQSNINSTALNKALLEFLKNYKETDRVSLSMDVVTILDKLNRSDIPQEEYEPLIRKFVPNQERAEDLFNETINIGGKIALFKLFANLNKKKYTDIISDKFMKKLKDIVLETIVKTSTNETHKLQGLMVLTHLKNSVLNYQDESKELNNLIKNTFQNYPARKIFKQIEGISSYNRQRFINRLFLEFSLLFEKDTTVDRIFLLKVLDKFAHMRWSGANFYNKVITDYEKNYDFFSNYEHAELINCFARVELNKEDVVRASIKNINTRVMSETDKFNLFNSLLKLGFTNQEWRELVLDKLLKEIDFNFAVSKVTIKEKFQFLINLWKLQLENWPANNSEILESSIQTINKYNKFKVTDKNLRQNVLQSEEWIGIIRRAPFFNKFDPELQATIDTIFKSKVERDETGFTMKLLSEYVRAMGHTNVEFEPTEVLCDMYLPESKTAIFIVKKQYQSIATNELNPTGQFIVDLLKSQGHNPVAVPFSINEHFNKDDEVTIVNFLESLNIPNKVKNGDYNFSSIESFMRNVNETRNRKAPTQTEAVVSDDE